MKRFLVILLSVVALSFAMGSASSHAQVKQIQVFPSDPDDSYHECENIREAAKHIRRLVDEIMARPETIENNITLMKLQESYKRLIEAFWECRYRDDDN